MLREIFIISRSTDTWGYADRLMSAQRPVFGNVAGLSRAQALDARVASANCSTR
jgi:hypothetical protein